MLLYLESGNNAVPAHSKSLEFVHDCVLDTLYPPTLQDKQMTGNLQNPVLSNESFQTSQPSY